MGDFSEANRFNQSYGQTKKPEEPLVMKHMPWCFYQVLLENVWKSKWKCSGKREHVPKKVIWRFFAISWILGLDEDIIAEAGGKATEAQEDGHVVPEFVPNT